MKILMWEFSSKSKFLHIFRHSKIIFRQKAFLLQWKVYWNFGIRRKISYENFYWGFPTYVPSHSQFSKTRWRVYNTLLVPILASCWSPPRTHWYQNHEASEFESTFYVKRQPQMGTWLVEVTEEDFSIMQWDGCLASSFRLRDACTLHSLADFNASCILKKFIPRILEHVFLWQAWRLRRETYSNRQVQWLLPRNPLSRDAANLGDKKGECVSR